MKKQVELSITHNGKDVVAYPYSKKEHVQFENGMNIDEFVGQDIATPTITHDTTAIKVGVGDSDVSGSVVDGTVNMTIKGQTYQNILPEPTLRNEMIGKSMQRLNEGYDNIEVVDGVSKSAILKGQTKYKNIDGQFYDDLNIFQSCLKLVGKNIDSSGGIFDSGVRNTVDFVAINEDSKVKLSGLTLKNLVFYDGDKTLISVVGVNTTEEYVLNTPVGARFFRFSYDNTVDLAEASITISTLTMQSVKMPVLTTTGKNLLKYSMDNVYTNSSRSHYAPILNEDGSITLNSCYDEPYWLKKGFYVEKGKEYTVTVKGMKSGDYSALCFGFDNLKYLDGGAGKALIPANTSGNCIDTIDTYGTKKMTCTALETGYVTRFYIHGSGLSAKYTILEFQVEEGSTPTLYEPYKSNILTVNEEVELRGIGDVQDTLDLTTGELTERISTFKPTGAWSISREMTNTILFTVKPPIDMDLSAFITCDNLPVVSPDGGGLWDTDIEGIGRVARGDLIRIRLAKTKASTLQEFENYTQSNPITIQYQLATESVKTVDLSSHGNWEKVVLDGSDSITYGANWNETGTAYYTNLHFDHPHVFSDRMTKTGGWSITEPDHSFALRENNKKYQLVLVVYNQHTNGAHNVQGLKQYLSQNPITFWYQTTTTQDNSIREMLSFANGHLQVSSEAENSLLPSVQYEIPTKNSYHMDLMKTNTLYTMKAKSVSGTFTIDGTSYNVNANGAFTSPSSMTDKLLIMSNKTNEEVMLLEGNVIDKTIPYFKGIKSAFEGEDKIEVLSTGKNLWTGADNYINSGANIIIHDENQCVFEHHAVNNGIKVKVSDYEYQTITMSYDFEILDGKALNVGGHNRHQTIAYYIDGINVGTNYHNGHVTTYEKNRVYHVDHVVHINLPIPEGQNNDREHIGIEPNRYSADTPTYCKMRVTNFQITLGNVIQEYEPHKSNSTKIPLLSPLRSLPNGVCDELIIDRLNHKAKLIQRVGELVLNGNEEWTQSQIRDKHYIVMLRHCSEVGIPERYPSTLLCSRFINQQPYGYDREGINVHTNYNFHIGFLKNRLLDASVNSCKKWLSQNPTTVLYELNTPIITEIDLEGYPYAYKDGHIFFNSDIAPTTQITYSINQAQQIESANENLQRHEKEISHLQKLIAQYIQVEYESTLLSLKI